MYTPNLISYIDGLYSYAISLTHEPDEANNLVLETYVYTLEAIAPPEFEPTMKTQLFRTLRRVWLSRLSEGHSIPDKIGRDNCAVGIEASQSARTTLGFQSLQGEHRNIREAIRELPLELREIVLLRDHEKFSYREITKIVGCTFRELLLRRATGQAILKLIFSTTKRRD
jgi:RNA polymerase sigma-70 factor, ECF subfamily